jgi:hypothetical protein
MRAKNESSSNPARSTSNSPSSSPTARRKPPANAFSAAFLEVARHLERRRGAAGEGAFGAGVPERGPFTVEPVTTDWGTRLWAVTRRGDPLGQGGGAVALFRERTAALLAAAVLPASATPNHLKVGETPKRLGFPLHDGERHVGHLATPHEHLPRDLHVARHLATHPDAIVLLAEALDYETLVLLGRTLMRRMEQAMATATATA